jgi:hypothetical protein
LIQELTELTENNDDAVKSSYPSDKNESYRFLVNFCEDDRKHKKATVKATIV